MGLNVDHYDKAITRRLPGEYVEVEMWPYSIGDGGDVHVAEFIVREAMFCTDGTVGYQRKGSPKGPDPVDGRENGEWEWFGGLKRDGCVNYTYNDVGCMLHACGLHGFDAERRIWDVIYAMGKEVMATTVDF